MNKWESAFVRLPMGQQPRKIPFIIQIINWMENNSLVNRNCQCKTAVFRVVISIQYACMVVLDERPNRLNFSYAKCMKNATVECSHGAKCQQMMHIEIQSE